MKERTVTTDRFDATGPETDEIVRRLEDSDRRCNRRRRATGRAFFVAAVLFTVAVTSGALSHFSFSHSMPFITEAQKVVNGLDRVLVVLGEISFGLGLAAVGLAKMGAARDPRLQTIDDWSSKEASSDGASTRPGKVRQVLRLTVAGKIPVVASVGVALAAFSASIGTEVSDGPQRPIVAALSRLAPGNEMVTGYAGAMPMIESNISRSLAERVMTEARGQNVAAAVLNENLGQLTTGDQTLSDLAFGIAVPKASALGWYPLTGCGLIPVGVDRLGRIANGRQITVDGVPARVVEQVNGTSATNRIGIVMDEAAMATCLQKDPNAPVHAIVLNTSAGRAKAILATANVDHETSAVISKARYLRNSQNFWAANVKPITNVLAVFSGLFAFVAMGGAMRERLVRNRRELAAKSAAGVSDHLIRATELLRATKDGIAATLVGGAVSFATPFVVNSLESGFKAGIGLRELAVGAAVGMLGTFGGALRCLIHPQRTIQTAENTRV